MREQKQLKQKQFRHSFYRDQEPTVSTDFVYDEIYKNASAKNKYSTNPKYTYYNTLLNMKQKLSKEQAPVFNNLFHSTPQTRKEVSSFSVESQPKALLPIYHVERINKMKFKIYKQGGVAQYIDKVPVTDLSFQIKIAGEEGQHPLSHVKPRLQQILSEYRKMNINSKHSRSRVNEYRNNLPGGSDQNGKTLRKTVYRFSRSGSQRT